MPIFKISTLFQSSITSLNFLTRELIDNSLGLLGGDFFNDVDASQTLNNLLALSSFYPFYYKASLSLFLVGTSFKILLSNLCSFWWFSLKIMGWGEGLSKPRDGALESIFECWLEKKWWEMLAAEFGFPSKKIIKKKNWWWEIKRIKNIFFYQLRKSFYY